MKATALQVEVACEVIIADGLTVTVTVKVVPVQLPEVAVTL